MRDRDAGRREVADPALELEVATGRRALRRPGSRPRPRSRRCARTFWNGPVTKSVIGMLRAGRSARSATTWPPSAVTTRGPVALRVGVAQRADQGAAVAHQRVGDQRRGGGHRRLLAGQQLGVLELGVAAQRADVQTCRRRRRGDSRGPGRLLMSTRSSGAAKRSFSSGTRLCPPASTFASPPPCLQQLDRLVERARGLVAEPRRIHASSYCSCRLTDRRVSEPSRRSAVRRRVRDRGRRRVVARDPAAAPGAAATGPAPAGRRS